MKEKVENKSAAEQQEEAFRKKADHYLVCFISSSMTSLHFPTD